MKLRQMSSEHTKYLHYNPPSMSYRIPKDDEIAKAIENCLSRSPKVKSQKALNELVLTELMCVD